MPMNSYKNLTFFEKNFPAVSYWPVEYALKCPPVSIPISLAGAFVSDNFAVPS